MKKSKKTKAKKRKAGPRAYELRPSPGGGWHLKNPAGGVFMAFGSLTKKSAIAAARRAVRPNAPAQLRIFTKRRRIEKGGSGEASYGRNSTRRKG